MNTRNVGGIGVAAMVLVIGAVVAFAQPGQTQEKKLAHTEHDEMMQTCAKACSDCQRACDTCATHCTHLLHAGKKEHLTTAMSCQDCATVCVAAAQKQKRCQEPLLCSRNENAVSNSARIR